MLTPEIEILLLCAQTSVSAEQASRIRSLFQAGIDLEYLIDIAQHHLLIPLLCRNLGASCQEVIPEHTLNRLRDYFNNNVQHNRFLTTELLNLLAVFVAGNIRVIPFKGPTLAATAYGDISLRQFRDLDILIHERDILIVEDLLLSKGYRLEEKWIAAQTSSRLLVNCERGFICDAGVKVDLHWGITPWFFPFPIDFEQLWQRRGLVNIDGTMVHNVSSEDLLLILCVHGSKHYWERLEWICDVAELVRHHQDMNWGALFDQATVLRSRRMLFLGLELARDFLRTSIPREVMEKMNADSSVKSLALRVRRRLLRARSSPLTFLEKPHTSEDIDIDTVCFMLGVREHLQDKIRYCFRIAYPIVTPVAKDRMFLPLPAYLSFLYYCIRPIRLVWKCSLALFGSVRKFFHRVTNAKTKT